MIWIYRYRLIRPLRYRRGGRKDRTTSNASKMARGEGTQGGHYRLTNTPLSASSPHRQPPIHRRCLELEYLAASKQSKSSDEKGGGESGGSGGGGSGGGERLTVVSPSGRSQTTRGAEVRHGGSSSSRGDREIRLSSTSSSSATPNVIAGTVYRSNANWNQN